MALNEEKVSKLFSILSNKLRRDILLILLEKKESEIYKAYMGIIDKIEKK